MKDFSFIWVIDVLITTIYHLNTSSKKYETPDESLPFKLHDNAICFYGGDFAKVFDDKISDLNVPVYINFFDAYDIRLRLFNKNALQGKQLEMK